MKRRMDTRNEEAMRVLRRVVGRTLDDLVTELHFDTKVGNIPTMTVTFHVPEHRPPSPLPLPEIAESYPVVEAAGRTRGNAMTWRQFIYARQASAALREELAREGGVSST